MTSADRCGRCGIRRRSVAPFQRPTPGPHLAETVSDDDSAMTLIYNRTRIKMRYWTHCLSAFSINVICSIVRKIYTCICTERYSISTVPLRPTRRIVSLSFFKCFINIFFYCLQLEMMTAKNEFVMVNRLATAVSAVVILRGRVRVSNRKRWNSLSLPVLLSHPPSRDMSAQKKRRAPLSFESGSVERAMHFSSQRKENRVRE